MGPLQIALIVAAVVVVGSFAAGAYSSYDAPKPDPNDPSNTNCTQCELDRQWYESLPGWHQAMIIVWWLANRTVCAVKGCP